MQEPSAELFLVRGRDDGPPYGAEHQEALEAAVTQLRAGGLSVQPTYLAMASVDAAGGLVGQFLLSPLKDLAPTIGVVLAAWLHGRMGRQVRLKVGDIEASATTVEGVKELVAFACQVQSGVGVTPSEGE